MACIPTEEPLIKQNRRIGLVIAVFCVLLLVITTAAASGLCQVKLFSKSLVAGNRIDSGIMPSGPPPGGVLPNGTAPCGPPPGGVMPNRTPPSGEPPSAPVPSG